jgi:hypothetical protein
VNCFPQAADPDRSSFRAVRQLLAFRAHFPVNGSITNVKMSRAVKGNFCDRSAALSALGIHSEPLLHAIAFAIAFSSSPTCTLGYPGGFEGKAGEALKWAVRRQEYRARASRMGAGV